MFEFLQSIADFFSFGIYQWFEDATKFLISSLIVWWLEMQLSGLIFAWDVAKGVVSNLGIASAITGAWSALPADVAASARFFRIPEALNLLLTAGVTRFVMTFIPGI